MQTALADGGGRTIRRGRPRLADRERLLDAAERAIRCGGPEVSLDRIAATAGVSKPVLFAHVGARRAHVRALGERLLARTDAAIIEAMSGAGGERAALERGIAAQLRTIAGDHHVYAFVNADPRLAEMLDFARRTAAPLIKWIAARRKAAGQDPSVAEAWGIAIMGIRHMVGVWWLADRRHELDEAQLAAQIVELLWSGLGPDSATGEAAKVAPKDTAGGALS